jgi:glucose-6-phosphate 1-epimerase
MDIEQLNSAFCLNADELRIVPGKGNLPCIEIDNGKARALISIYGGQVLSYQPSNADSDLMFLSNLAYFAPPKAIKGGIPICWPWFGPDPEEKGRPAHGFARNSTWKIQQTGRLDNGDTLAILRLEADEANRNIWPYEFELDLQIIVGERLNLTLITRNKSDSRIYITQAMHSYFNIGDINQTRVLGLEGCAFIDKVDGEKRKQQEGSVSFAGEVDRIYQDTPSRLTIEDRSMNRKIHIDSTGSQSAVVWNPWSEISTNMADLEDNDYQRFVCVETTNAADDLVSVEAGEDFQLNAIYTLEQL